MDASRADADEARLARARLAYERRDWAAARTAYARIGDRTAIAAEDVDRESRCAWWLGDTPASIAASEDLVHRLEDAGRNREAAMVALRLGLQWALRGDLAIHAGWYAKARRLLAALPVGPEHGYLQYVTAMMGTDDTGMADDAEAARVVGLDREAGRLREIRERIQGVVLSRGAAQDGLVAGK